MHPVSPPLLCLPGENQWEWWRRGNDGTWQTGAAEGSSKNCIQAVPMQSLVSSPFPALLPPDGDTASLQATTGLRWGALGVDATDTGCHWTSWQVAQRDQQVLIGTLALADAAFKGPAQEAQGFEPSVGFYPIPANNIALWKEMGRLVIAFKLEEQLLHAAVLSARELYGDAVREIRDISQILAVNWPLDAWSEFHVWTEASDEFKQALEKALTIKVIVEPKPAPQLHQQPSGLLPAAVAIGRKERRKQSLILRNLMMVAGMIVLGFIAWAGWLAVQEQKLNRESAEIHARQPQVDEVQQAQLQWWALEPAINRENYPLEVFRQVVSLLPNEGIRFKEFSIDTEKLVVSGEASSLIHASKFQTELRDVESLKRFAFNAPQPTILDDNRANFRVEGNTKPGGADAAQ